MQNHAEVEEQGCTLPVITNSKAVVVSVAAIPHNGGANVLWGDGHAKGRGSKALTETPVVNTKTIASLWTIENS